MDIRSNHVENVLTVNPQVLMPETPEEAHKLFLLNPESSSFIAGGTVIQMQREQGILSPSILISLEKIIEMKRIYAADHYLSVGAFVSLSDCISHFLLKDKASLLLTALKSIAAPAVRNRGTIGGNIAYEKGDALPALLAMDAQVQFFDGTYRSENIDSFLKRRWKHPLITSIRLPLKESTEDSFSFFKKVGMRQAFSLSLVTVAGRLCLDENRRCSEVRIGIGSSNQLPQRLPRSESLLEGSILTVELLNNLFDTLTEEFHPSSDILISGEYRKTAAANIILFHLYQLCRRRKGEKG
ncbi:FAD binding domain-containing protein [Alteribacillus sp. HJP-4]|uniref:FAD binding domain-containing protein n=1 Tax=Alteribacillus sp. HJP-4 TaxID=2775394 RepID=UPI0035CD11C1